MRTAKKFRGCRIMLYPTDSEQLLVDTTVTDYNPQTNVVFIPELDVDKLPSASVRVRILANPDLYEYNATVRVGMSHIRDVEVALYRERKVEDRRYHRHKVDAVGVIESVIIGKQELKAMIDDGKPVEVNCHFCNQNYAFTVEELRGLLLRAGTG